MKKLLEINVSFEGLYKMLIVPVRAKLLLTGIELKIFNRLSEPKSADTVAEAIGSHKENTRLFLDGLAASDLVQKKNGLYRNTPASQAFLVEDSPTYLGQLFTIATQISWYANLDDLSKMVKEGPPPLSKEAEMGSEEMWAQFAVSMAGLRAGRPGTAGGGHCLGIAGVLVV